MLCLNCAQGKVLGIIYETLHGTEPPVSNSFCSLTITDRFGMLPPPTHTHTLLFPLLRILVESEKTAFSVAVPTGGTGSLQTSRWPQEQWHFSRH